MNYRHHYHAGNFADVMKHAVLVQLVRGMQRKDKGFLYLDTHAGRGSYDLAEARHGDTLERKPEHPGGIGRLIANDASAAAGDAWLLPGENARKNPGAPGEAALADYLGLVRDFDRRSGNLDPNAIRFYPGSPGLMRALMRPQDRMALCELHPGEYQSLRGEFKKQPAVSVHELDGYTALRAMLPAPEKRALVLVDPPYEALDEDKKITSALRESLRRMSAATCAVWYPLTERARANEFLDKLAMLNPPPTLAVELAVAGENSGLKMRGCGLAIINPPWKIDQTLKPMLAELATRLAQGPGAGSTLEWIVRE